MLRRLAFAAALLAAPVAQADKITLQDEAGAAIEVDTAALSGCTILFDSAGTPFELCRMKKVELTPPSSTRSRPGQAESASGQAAAVVYVKATE